MKLKQRWKLVVRVVVAAALLAAAVGVFRVREIRRIDGLIYEMVYEREPKSSQARDALFKHRRRLVVSRLAVELRHRDAKDIVIETLVEIGPEVVPEVVVAASWRPSTPPSWLEWWVELVRSRQRNRGIGGDHARECIVRMGEAAVPPLLDVLTDRRPAVRRKAAHFLIHIVDERAVEPLIAALGDPDEKVRGFVAYALGELADTRAVEPLIEAFRSEQSSYNCTEATPQGCPFELQFDPHSIDILARVLGKFGDVRAVEPLIEALQGADPGLFYSVAGALGRLGDTRAVEPLIAGLDMPDRSVRITAVNALGELGDTRAVGPLLAALGDKDGVVRERAANALGKLGDRGAVEPLIAALGDKDSDVRWQAAKALGTLGDERAVEPLIAALGDDESSVRSSAAWALGELGSRRAVEALIKALEKSDTHVAAAICRALLSVGGEEAHKAIEARLGGIDLSYVQENYARIIAEGDAKFELALILALEESSDLELARHLCHSNNTPLFVGAFDWIYRTRRSGKDLDTTKHGAPYPKWGEGGIEK